MAPAQRPEMIVLDAPLGWREIAAHYRDDRPLADDIARARALLRSARPGDLQAVADAAAQSR